MKLLKYSLFSIFFLLAACQPAQRGGTEPTPTLTFTITQKAESTFTPSPTPKFTPTSAPDIITVPVEWQLEGLGLIAFISGIKDASIKLMAADGSYNLTLLDSNTIDIDSHVGLSWSPDGRYLAFGNHWDILSISVEGGIVHNITNTPVIGIGEGEANPAWSPDGNRIAFDSGKNIYLISPDGSNREQLTNCPVNCWFPTWSPTGQTIAYISDNGDLTYDIYSIKVDGSDQKQLTHEGSNLYPDWSPDGRFIAFARSYADSVRYLYLMTPEGKNLVALTDDTFNVGTMSWSPDNNYIVFTATAESAPNYHLWMIDCRSGETQPFNFIDDFPHSPDWMPSPRLDVLVPQSNCASGWTRLVAGEHARVAGAPTDPPNRVRSEPIKIDNTIGYVTPGTILTVLEGPVCADGLVFWLVSSDSIPGGSGWTAEGDGTEYYLEPYTP